MKRDLKYEYEMYPYIEEYFSNLGYEMRAEVNCVDVVGVKSDHIIAIEMKLNLSVKLIYQAIERQRYVDDVYIATVASKSILKDLDELKKLVKRLQIGLILLHERDSGIYVEIVETPRFSKLIFDVQKQNLLFKEFYGRTVNLNIGGITKNSVATANREKNVNIATILLKTDSELSIKQIRSLTKIQDCAKILQSNFYEFFKRTKKAHYVFNKDSDRARLEYNRYPELVEFYSQKYGDLNYIKEAGE